MNKSAEKLTHLANQDLRALLEHRGKPAISIYLPPGSLEATRISYQQALHEAEQQLEDEVNSQELQVLLMRLQSLQNHEPFWQQACEGLALYVSADAFLYACAACVPEKRVVVDDFFYVIPLISHYLSQKSFHILNLNGKVPRLYVASQRDIRPLPLASAPAGDQLARELQGFLQHQLNPLLVICSERSRFESLRAQLSQLRIELDCHHCALNTQSLQRLHRQAWQQISPLLESEQDQALQAWQALRHTPKALQDVLAVAQAAYNSRVEKLFLIAPVHIGQDASLRRKRIEELLNRAAIYTYLNGGKVYTVRPEELGGAEEAAAILRY